MGYYNISILTASQDTTTIVTEFGKSRYNILPMVICASGDTLQANVDEIIGDIEGVKIYIGDMLVLSKIWFTNQIEQLKVILGDQPLQQKRDNS